MKKIAILQSNYIPWKGYFDIINMVDEFIFHDDIQYTKNDWRNRNKIKTDKGLTWITIPCGINEKRLICEVELLDHSWQKKHWSLITNYYSKTQYWKYYKVFFEDFYLGQEWDSLSELNQKMIISISNELLNVKTIFKDSRDFNLTKSKEERVIELLKKNNASNYLSGPAAKDYIDVSYFLKNNIKVSWMDYSNYPEYNQLFPPFEHGVSIIDLIFNEGPNAYKFLKSFQKTEL